MKHVVSVRDFLERRVLEDVFSRARKFSYGDRLPGHLRAMDTSLEGYQVVTLFYQPSTRTRMSFELAVHKLGGKVVSSENAGEFSSAVKGETIEDTVRVLSGYLPLALIIRHPEKGTLARAACALDEYKSRTCVINAGDGDGEHPTQALLDAYTIQSECKGIDGKEVALVGDLKYGRTVHSLAQLLTLYDVRVRLVSPLQLSMPNEYVAQLQAAGIQFDVSNDLRAAQSADVVYMTRVQREKFESQEEYDAVKGLFIIDEDFVDGLKPGAKLLHPLPRVNEITREVDRNPRAAYFRQAGNGLYVRMALLQMLAESDKLR